MKKIALGLFVTSMALNIPSFASASVCTNHFGSMECSSGEIESINHLGDLSLSGTHVLGQLTLVGNVDANNSEIGSGDITGIVDASHIIVNQQLKSTGKFQASNSSFHGKTKIIGNFKGKNDVFDDRVMIVGNVDLNNETLKGESEFTGMIEAKYSMFSAPILLNACESSFDHSVVHSLTISAQKNCSSGSQLINIRDQTQIKGDIQFAGGNGKVYLGKNSSINGRVVGGVIIRE